VEAIAAAVEKEWRLIVHELATMHGLIYGGHCSLKTYKRPLLSEEVGLLSHIAAIPQKQEQQTAAATFSSSFGSIQLQLWATW
jgi:hypothetical protein